MRDTAVERQAETGLPVVCRMEAQPAYRLGQPIVVTGILRNTGPVDLWILRRNTFLQPHLGDGVLLTRDGTPVPRAGIAVFHGAPGAESYVRIAAGETARAELDLSDAYRIGQGGEYRASFRFPLLGIIDAGASEPPRNPDRLTLAMTTSNEVTFRIDGAGEAPPVEKAEAAAGLSASLAGGYPAEPKRPQFANMSDSEQKDWFDAHRTAYKNIVGSIRRLSQNQPDFLYGKWFESPGQQQRPKVLATLTAMADWMATTSILYRKSEQNCKFDMMAWTYPGARNLINLCDNAFNGFLLAMNSMTDQQWARSFLLVHEISHAVASTSDHWYSWKLCMMLPFSWPEQAATNASSYALFVMQADASQPYEPTGDFDLKTGDRIALVSNNGAYLANTWYVSGGDYIAATGDKYRFMDADFTVTVHEEGGSRVNLQLTYDGSYLQDAGTYLRHGPKTPDDSCSFRIGAFENHDGETLLVLQSYRGKIFTQIDDSYRCVVAKEDGVNQWCLFKLVRTDREART